jgi:predicted XRE-type DNA-binding protein
MSEAQLLDRSASPTAKFLSNAIESSCLSQRMIADRIGYPNPNVISMMKKGVTKVPINRIPQLAKVCGVDERAFLKIALSEYQPETWEVIQRHLISPSEA